ncbi:GGDEF domain-containing protein [Oryzicola mucosus]|uniref:diguanylate cyclase n=1 Tax=Oryzicola mucosus TaxID=2767425 RepID=A0A8J6PUG6_9HYPH|nr:GGDEF domain-containing protein [Oryzicola mucosus]MBD0414032.1 GGDEF domain-containing protein [Oryzicola mucosus]
MSGAEFILTINLCGAALLAGAFFGIALYDKRRGAACWFAFAYLLGMVYTVLEFVTPLFANGRYVFTVAFAAFLATTISLTIGLARKYHVRFPLWATAPFFAVCVVLVYLFEDMERTSIIRMMAYQLPFTIMQIAGAIVVLRSSFRRDTFDYLLVGLFFASGLQFAAKPFVALYFGDSGMDTAGYLQSNYAMVSQSLGTIFSLAIALMLLVILMRDVLSEATMRSETDTLSGLLNRRGFERRASETIHNALAKSLYVSMVACDLDHFKVINDTFGHAAGDRVIQAFSQFLSASSPGSHILGRLGGEEFAVILPGTPLSSARLFAEGIRVAFAGMAIDGLPQGQRFTASFGVAELAERESLYELTMRADSALYDAKNSGRDCVRVSATPQSAGNLIYPFGNKPPAI